jgi:putative SOS response-associated peptidase YedK
MQAMCTRCITPEQGDVERFWQITGRNPMNWARDVYPGYQDPFNRAARDGSATPELVVGQWALIPWFAKERKLKYPTGNARSEELAQKASYKHPWARGQRCIIPAAAFFEPCWETGKHVPWMFRRADGAPGRWPGCGTPGPTRPRASWWRATPCSRSTPMRTR